MALRELNGPLRTGPANASYNPSRMRRPPITIKCECGETEEVAYGERWRCERCGRSWNTQNIPAEEYEGLLRRMRRHKLEVLRKHCEDVGRDPSEIQAVSGKRIVIRKDRAEAQSVLERIASKEATRRLLAGHGLPTIPGSDGMLRDDQHALDHSGQDRLHPRAIAIQVGRALALMARS